METVGELRAALEAFGDDQPLCLLLAAPHHPAGQIWHHLPFLGVWRFPRNGDETSPETMWTVGLRARLPETE